MKNNIYRIVCLFLLAMLLVGCQQHMPVSETEPTQETSADHAQIIQVDALIAYGINTEGNLDGEGLYYPYDGGEMSLELYLQASGMQDSGVTVLLFLDGQPQPYRLEDSNGTAYMHTVYPQDLNDNLFGVSFTPVTGSSGDMLELCVMYLPAYRYPNSDGQYPWYDERNVRFYMTRIKLEEAPSIAELPEIPDRVLSMKSLNIDEKRYGRSIGMDASWNLFFNAIDTDGNVISSMDESERRRLYIELYSDPPEEYVLILYVDNEPVLVDGEALTFQLTKNQTLLAEIDLDCTGLDYMMFAVLLEKDYSGETVGWETYPIEENFNIFYMNTG